MAEEALLGGFDPSRQVVRVGDTVRRPSLITRSVRSLLSYLRAVDFDGAPLYLGSDEDGRSVFKYIDGEVPLPPYPDWSMTEAALISVGRLLQRFHEATAGFTGDFTGWSQERGDPLGGPVICHNDLFPENIIFRGGSAIALIDFDMAAPGRPLWDLAITIREWAPLHAPTARPGFPPGLDPLRRAALLAAAYGLRRRDAAELCNLIFESRAHSLAQIQLAVAAGQPFWSTYWPLEGKAQALQDERWLNAIRGSLHAQLEHAGV